MATLLDQYIPFDEGPGSNVQEAGWRDIIMHMNGSASGVIRGFDNEFEPYGDSSGMQVKVMSGRCLMRGHYGRSTAEKILTISAAHATLARKDAVVLRVDFGANEISLDVLTGTASASPVQPTLTTDESVWETLVSVVDVPAAAVTITSANVVDHRMYTTAHARFNRTTTQVIPVNVETKIGFNSIVTRAGDIVGNGGLTEFTLNRAGLWQIKFNLGADAAAGYRQIAIKTNTDTLAISSVGESTDVNVYLNAQADVLLDAGTVVHVWFLHNRVGGLSTRANGVRLTFTWIGP